MYIFKIGDKVKVKHTANKSTSGIKLRGRIGTIIKVMGNEDGYVCLDIENNNGEGRGIWKSEIDLYVKKPIKIYGIVKFMAEIS